MERIPAVSPAPGLAAGARFVCSWSGGKDSCLAFHRAIAAGYRPLALLTMLREDGERSRSHGLPLSVLRSQAAALGVPLMTRPASWESYEPTFIEALRSLKRAGAELAVFGDIDLEEHRDWEEKVSQAAGLMPFLPLWQSPRTMLMDELLSLGYRAMVVATCDEKLGNGYLGKPVERGMIHDFECLGVDACGEQGEYHTVVTDGPIFGRPLLLHLGEMGLHSGYWFIEVRTHRPEQNPTAGSDPQPGV